MKRKINWKRLCMEKESDILALRNQIDYLVRTIRATDDKLFAISQCTDWPQMRPRLNALVEEMITRKVMESNRINSLITGELHNTYKEESAALKQLTKK